VVSEPRRRATLLAFIGAGGAIGTAARYGTELAIPAKSGVYPLATFLVNVVGAVILGALGALPAGSLPAHNLSRPAIGTGFCGGLTTFSTMSLEIYQRWPGNPEVAAGYAAASLLAAPACAWTGNALLQAARKRLRTGRPPPGSSKSDKP
jgi:CrcB protein